MPSGGLMAAAGASWDVEVSCQTMWEAFGPTFSPGFDDVVEDAAYSFRLGDAVDARAPTARRSTRSSG